MEIPIYTSNDAPPLLSGLTDAVLTLMYTVTGPVVMDIPNDWEDLMAIIELPTAAAVGDPAGVCLPKDFRANIVSKLQGNATSWRDDVGSYVMRPTADKIAGLRALRPQDNKAARKCLGKAIAALYCPNIQKAVQKATNEVHQKIGPYIRAVQDGAINDPEVLRALNPKASGLSEGLTKMRDEAMDEPIPTVAIADLVNGIRPITTATTTDRWAFQQIMANRLAPATAHALSGQTNHVSVPQGRQILLQTKHGRAFEDDWMAGRMVKKHK